ncbi:MAG: FlgD immunoglobulin-like domain containing protein [bacterium]|nr:FlgD immunoglobulin-like domain containing protein [bacterium]
MYNLVRVALLFLVLTPLRSMAIDWSAWTPVDTNTGISYNAFASKIPCSRNMSMVWTKSVLDDGLWNGHVIYKTSQDGGNTWGSNIDIMNLIPKPRPHYNDIPSLRSTVGNTYGIYDSQENIHIVTDVSLGTSTDGSYYPAMCCALLHYSSEYDSVYIISYHSYPYPDPNFFKWMPASGGSWSDVLYPYYGGIQAKPVISEDPITKILYVIWVEFPVDTYGVAGYEAGEIYASYSLDRGRNWAPKMNLTMTPGDCEVFATMSPIVNDTLHFMYELDMSGYDDIYKTALDPNKNPFIRVNQPIKRGDVSVLSINGPTDEPDSLTAGDIVIPNATYKNNGTESVEFQARFELNRVLLFDLGDSVTPESLVTPSIIYYDVKNVTIPAGDTLQVAFKPWTVMGDSGAQVNGYYEVYATMLIDTVLDNNYMDTTFVVKPVAKKSYTNVSSIRVNSYPALRIPDARDRNINSGISDGIYNKFKAVSGDTFGCSQYDRQWNKAPMRLIIWDPRNNFTHTLWMKELTTGGVLRHMFYNCNEGSGWTWPGLDGGAPVQSSARDGYGCMDLDTAGSAVVVMHKLVGTRLQSCVYGDAIPGMGAFMPIKELSNAPGDSQTIWPVVAVDGAGDMIVLAYADTTINQPMNMNQLWYSSYRVGVEEANSAPKIFTVSSTYPNPAKNGIASIKYSLPNASNVAVKVYDITGKLVNTLVNESRKAGAYTTTWNGKNAKGNKASTGLYFYRVEACSKIETRKIVLVK